MKLLPASVPAMLLAAQAVFAQSNGGDSLTQTLVDLKGTDAVSKVVSDLSEDIPMTTAPAAFVLGVAGEQVPRFTTFREFAAAAGRAVDKDGKLVNNISAEIAPLLALHALRLEDQKNWYLRAAARTTFSLVSIAGSDNNTNARVAYGVQSVLYSREMDEGIAKASSGECRTAADSFLKSLPPVGGTVPTLPSTPEPLTAEENAKIKGCQDAIDQILNRWNQSTVVIGFGQAFNSVDSNATSLHKANRVAWLTGSLGFSMSNKGNGNEDMGGLLTLHVRSEGDNVIDSPADSSIKLSEDATLFGANFRIGKARFNGLLEYSDRRGKVATLATERRKRLLIGAEYRLQEDFYLSFAVGSEHGRGDGNNSDLALANLKWGFGRKALFAP